ncbi:MAG TPA: hypothetical protein VEL12_17430 [Candidatus Nitrosopolaris sp.]|nr:hypothetical protein [Candidatus Nitrosopolaris sp.]
MIVAAQPSMLATRIRAAYAWTDPAEVTRYVRENACRLNGLSRREALKNIG